MNILKIGQALNKAYRKQSVTRTEMDRYKAAFITLLDKMGDSDEEKQKTYVSQFLRDVFYQEYDITPHEYYDLIIRTGKTAKDPIGVLFEVKAPKNKAEMVTQDNLAAKAMYELLLYYLRERVDGGNNDLKHLVITNVQEWYVFDAKLFEKLFYENKKLLKEYAAWSIGQKTTSSTALFYKEIAPKYVAEVADQLEFTWFSINKYEKAIRNTDLADDNKLVALYKLMSPQHMLKLAFANDSNSLDKQFYTELLHIIGLEEYKDKGKKLISRKPEGERDPASLLEMCIRRIEDRNKLPKLKNPGHFGDTDSERVFNVALELCITWMNRVLFLKLLEAQLLTYNNADQRFKFLHSAFIPEFDELEKLFFDVLAKRPNDRRGEVKDKFAHIPYLNSSLFEQTGLEEDLVSITDMDDLATMPLYSSTVLKGPNGRPLPKGTELRTMHYLFAFLEAYNFSSEGTEEIQEQNKRLINASVLGLIFEKINGYKDGSFFTPGFITMYMCRETIRRATVQKFNDAYGWKVETFDQLHEHLEYHDAKKRKAYNEVINSLKICDPAVGSGHFLVSALNEVIAIKYDLNLLCYPNGNRVDKDWTLEIENDELMITDREEELNFFQYRMSSGGKPIANLQLLQEALFNEKQTIIENSLFGVDINPNSVKICRLRLWIELLKNAYYNAESSYTDLETLPNIDINIKEGNSLVSRFALTEDLTDVFKQNKFTIQSYRNAVAAYKDTTSREAKNDLLAFIKDIKDQFKDSVQNRDPRRKQLSKLRGEYLLLETLNTDLFGAKQMDEKKKELEMRRLKLLIAQREGEINDIEGNKIYRNAFEWRFEFPEVLDDNGDFVGFDAIIANPPYIRQEELKEWKEYFGKRFETYAGTADLYVYFVELGMELLKQEGNFTYILPNKWMRANYGLGLRKYLKKKHIVAIEDFGDLPVFEEATTYPAILQLQRSSPTEHFEAATIETLDYENGLEGYLNTIRFKVGVEAMQDEGWSLTNVASQRIIVKMLGQGVPLKEYVRGEIYYGIKTGLNEAFVIDEATKERLISEDLKSAELIKPFLAGRDIKRYIPPTSNKYLILVPKGFTIKKNLPVTSPYHLNEPPPRYGNMENEDGWGWFKRNYPAIASHLLPFKQRAEIRSDQGDFWWELRACDYYEEFDKPKIIFPDISLRGNFTIDKKGEFSLVNTAYFLSNEEYYLLGILASNLVQFFYKELSPAYRGGYLRFIYQYIEQIPIATTTQKSRKGVENLVTQILTAKEADPAADTSALEAEIDQLVYQLYGLTEEEIKIVEESVG